MSTQEADPWLTINSTIEGKLPNIYWKMLNKSLTNTRQRKTKHASAQLQLGRYERDFDLEEWLVSDMLTA